jgi:hypothetical protein
MPVSVTNHSVICTLGLWLRNKYRTSDVNRVTNLKAQPLHIFSSPVLVVMSLLWMRVGIVVGLLPGDNGSRFLGRKVRKARGMTKWDENTDIRHAPLKGFIGNGCKGHTNTGWQVATAVQQLTIRGARMEPVGVRNGHSLVRESWLAEEGFT